MLTWIRFPVRYVFCLLKIKCRDIRQTDRLAERKYVRFLQRLWKTYSSCIHSQVAVTLWSLNIWPLKFLVTRHKHFPCSYNITSARKWLTKLNAQILYKVPAILNIIKSQLSLQSTHASATRGEMKCPDLGWFSVIQPFWIF